MLRRAGLISFILSFFLLSISLADTLESKGVSFTPQFCSAINADGKNEYLVLLDQYKNNGVSTFSQAYEQTKEKYHSDINIYFNEKMNILSNDIYGNHEVSEKVCSPFPYSVDSSSLVVSQNMMELFQKYECALNAYISNPIMNGDEISFEQGISTLDTQQRVLRNEVSRSFKALELTIHMYSEMRMWYPVHRDLQCLASQVKTYNKSLREFVDQIVRMPAKFFNYGSRYQH